VLEPTAIAPSSRRPDVVASTLPVIVDALVVAGHDGQAELVVRVRFDNGATGSVTLNALFAERLMEDCQVESAAELIGQPCQRLFDLMPNPGRIVDGNAER